MRISIVTPEAAAGRPGNRVTADRWADILRGLGHDPEVMGRYGDEPCDLLVALHARKSHGSVLRFRRRNPEAPLVVALTGTDLYRDMEDPDSPAWESAERADCLVVLQERAPEALPERLWEKTRVIYQSVPELWERGRERREREEREESESAAGPTPGESQAAGDEAAARDQAAERRPEEFRGDEHRRADDVPSGEKAPADDFQVCLLAHLRPVKDPLRAAEAARLLPDDSRVRIVHCGAALAVDLEARARREMAENPRYLWLGEVARAKALRILEQSRLLVLTSRLEGAGNAVSEALSAGVPVVCSRVDGLVGMLGPDYPGYFPPEDTSALAALLHRAETDPALHRWLRAHCRRRAALVAPDREREAWASLLGEVAGKP